MSIKINVNEINEIFGLIIKKLNSENIDEIDIDDIMYWFVNTDNWNISVEKPEIEVGSLRDDWENLIKCKEKKVIHSYTEFDRLSAILRAISEKLAPIN